MWVLLFIHKSFLKANKLEWETSVDSKSLEIDLNLVCFSLEKHLHKMN